MDLVKKSKDQKKSQTQDIPEYLSPYIAHQDPSLYTPMDHASWRYILKLSRIFFAQYAHSSYLDGLEQTGISLEQIPLISEMDEKLKRFGWRAVPVIGFIPPAVFMEFLSLGILPIACDMRTLGHLAYTPAPDIVHEAAGHAPIVANSEYADYLRSYGEVSRRAIYSDQDMNVYQAIRELSDTKENPKSNEQEIQAAQDRLNEALKAVTFTSEATYLSRMGWWTFEYGLVGSIDHPKIYGAGLLSSLGESFHCIDNSVKKLPFSIQCIDMSYDITRPQPQLYVTPDFQTLKAGLEELSNQMAFRQGGIQGLEKAKQAGALTTTELNSGIQISGTLKNWIPDDDGNPCFLQFSGPTQLAYGDQEIEGQGASYHEAGYSTPLEELTRDQLSTAGFVSGGRGKLVFNSGVILEGIAKDIQERDGQVILVAFTDCTVRKGADILFRPEWGTYDVVCGKNVISVFGGAADRKNYLQATGGFQQKPARQKTNLTPENRELNLLYLEIRNLREQGQWGPDALDQLTQVYEKLEKSFPNDWLLRYELLELIHSGAVSFPWANDLKKKIQVIAKRSPELSESIQRGLDLLS